MSTHIDPITYAMELLAAGDAGKGKYDDPRYALYTVVAEMIIKLEELGSQVADVGDESSAFSTVQMDEQHVNQDLNKISTWWAAHKNDPGMSPSKALTMPEYIADVQAFEDDFKKLKADIAKYQPKYGKDGMDDAMKTVKMIEDTKVDGHSEDIGTMIKNGHFANLQLALLDAADGSDLTKNTGVFADWMNNGKGDAMSLTHLDQDLGLSISGWTQDLQKWGTYLSNDDDVGKNVITSGYGVKSMIDNQRVS